MKKLLSILLLGIVSLTASAQYQVANSNFEQWESVSYGSTSGEEPLSCEQVGIRLPEAHYPWSTLPRIKLLPYKLQMGALDF